MSETWNDVETKSGGDFKEFEIPPDGAIPARVCALIDVGTHEARTLKDEPYDRRVVILGYELGEQDSKGASFFMARAVTLSLDVKSTLYSIVKALHAEPKLGVKLDPDWLANKPCLLQVSHQTKEKKGKQRTYANIDSVGKPPRGTQTPAGTCVVWRVGSKSSLPDLSFLPSIWHEGTSKMMTVAEWVAASREAFKAGQTVMQTPNGSTKAKPMTQAEADAEADVIPF